MSSTATANDPDEDDHAELASLTLDTTRISLSTSDTEKAQRKPFTRTATNVGIYGVNRFFPGIPALSCKCSEKDSEIHSLRATHHESIVALSREHESAISLLSEQCRDKTQRQASLHAEELRRVEALVDAEILGRLEAAFTLLDHSWQKERLAFLSKEQATLERLENAETASAELVRAEQAWIADREAKLAQREQELISTRRSLSRRLQTGHFEMQKESDKYLRLRRVLSLVSEYQMDCAHTMQRQATMESDQLISEALAAKQEAQAMLDAANVRAGEVLEEAQKKHEEIIEAAQREAAAAALEKHRSSPTLSDVSTSAYSLRSYDSLPVLTEEPNAENDGYVLNGRTRRASFDASQNSQSGTRRMPIPSFPSGQVSEFGATEGSRPKFPVISKGERRKRTTSHQAPLETIAQGKPATTRRRVVSRGKAQPEAEGPKPFRPY